MTLHQELLAELIVNILKDKKEVGLIDLHTMVAKIKPELHEGVNDVYTTLRPVLAVMRKEKRIMFRESLGLTMYYLPRDQ